MKSSNGHGSREETLVSPTWVGGDVRLPVAPASASQRLFPSQFSPLSERFSRITLHKHGRMIRFLAFYST